MKKHIIHCGITTPGKLEFAKQFSDKYGYGTDDHEFVSPEFLGEVPYFVHCIDLTHNRTVTNDAVTKYLPYIDKDHLQIAVDDILLKKVLPTAAQCINLIGRENSYDTNYTKLERLYLKSVGFWAAYLRHHQIELALFTSVPHGGENVILLETCKALNISTYIFFDSLAARIYVLKTIEQPLSQLITHYKDLCKKYVDFTMEQIPLEGEYGSIFEKMSNPNTDKTPDYMEKQLKDWEHILHFIAYSERCNDLVRINRKSGNLKDVPLKVRIRAYEYEVAKLDFRLTGGLVLKSVLYLKYPSYRKDKYLRQYYKSLSVIPDFSKKYIYFPLHFQPECTSNPHGGGVYYQQMIPIRLIAESLPENVFVYVKEHPAQFYGSGARETGLYDELSTIPNVVLVDTDIDTYKLIENSMAVASLRGTAGFEGLFYGKPFIMFGYWVIQHMPGVFHVRSKEEVKSALDAILKGEYCFTLRDIKLFLKAMDETEGYYLGDLPQQNELDHQIQTNMELFEQAMGLPNTQEEVD